MILIIVILGYLEIDTEILDNSMETMEFYEYRKLSEVYRTTNEVLAVI